MERVANKQRYGWPAEPITLGLQFRSLSVLPWLMRRPRRGPVATSSVASMLQSQNFTYLTEYLQIFHRWLANKAVIFRTGIEVEGEY
jgi:hypothetical protein